MSQRTTLRLCMKLASDAIFASGFAAPGGEDIAVYQDEKGYPYFKGTSLKGLLRESVEHLIAWSDGDSAVVDTLFGTAGWTGDSDHRRLQCTSLTLTEQPETPDHCYSTRVFTALENGIVASKTLRSAICINAGLTFTGELLCDAQDVPLVTQGLQATQWVGALRNRGFGNVSWTWTEEAVSEQEPNLPETSCIFYQLRTQLPVVMTDLSNSSTTSYETRAYLIGTAIRGLVISTLSQTEPDWFATHKEELLCDETIFTNALPSHEGLVPLPTIKGFYEHKDETGLESVVIDGTFTPGKKRASLGSCCAIDGQTIQYWSAKTDGGVRILRNGGQEMFSTRYLNAGQTFQGYIMLKNPALAPQIAQVFAQDIWIGADRYEGFGRCSVEMLQAKTAPHWAETYGFTQEKDITQTLYLLALSPLSMLDAQGNPCGLDCTALAKALGVSRVTIQRCSTALGEYGGFNRTWGCRAPAQRMYESGSLFQLQCSEAPSLEAVLAVQSAGLGIRRGEGFGQVLFLRNDLFTAIAQKQPWAEAQDAELDSTIAQVRRAKCRWVMDEGGKIATRLNRDDRTFLSKSQLGKIQSLCEGAVSTGSTKDLDLYFEKNKLRQNGRDWSKFQPIYAQIRTVLAQTLEETLGLPFPYPTTQTEQLQLLCDCYNYSRKGEI